MILLLYNTVRWVLSEGVVIYPKEIVKGKNKNQFKSQQNNIRTMPSKCDPSVLRHFIIYSQNNYKKLSKQD